MNTHAPDREAAIGALAATAGAWRDPDHEVRMEAVERTLGEDNTFTAEALTFALNHAMAQIDGAGLRRWLAGRTARSSLRVGVLEAGNIPMAGLQDYLAVVLTGHRFVGRVSRRSPYLLPAFAGEVADRGGPSSRFVEGDGLLKQVDAVVASGSDETVAILRERCDAVGIDAACRLLRGSRFGVAVIDGRETDDERIALAEDILLHEGRGCRNVALVWAPEDLSPDPLLDAMAVFRGTFPAHPATSGSLRMQQALLKAVDTPHAYADGMAFLVSRGEPEVQPPGHVRWVPFSEVSQPRDWIAEHADRLQVVAARDGLLQALPTTWQHTSLGSAQRPDLDWAPDGVDTIGFLEGLACPQRQSGR